MIHTEGRINGVRGVDIFYQGWLPDGDIRALICIVHGLGEHSGRYMTVVDHFVPLGYAVYGCDHIGHGRSAGRREVVRRFTDFTDTLTIFNALLSCRHPAKPVFLFGHSMGGLIAAYFLLSRQHTFKGAVISAPLAKIGADITMTRIIIGRLLSILAPRVGIVQIDSRRVSRDAEVVRAYMNDPLVFHGRTPARLAAELLKAMIHVGRQAGTITLPLLLLQGSQDRLVDPEGARMLYDRVGSRDKTLHIYEGLCHEVFNEPERARVLADVAAWLARF